MIGLGLCFTKIVLNDVPVGLKSTRIRENFVGNHFLVPEAEYADPDLVVKQTGTSSPQYASNRQVIAITKKSCDFDVYASCTRPGGALRRLQILRNGFDSRLGPISFDINIVCLLTRKLQAHFAFFLNYC